MKLTTLLSVACLTGIALPGFAQDFQKDLVAVRRALPEALTAPAPAPMNDKIVASFRNLSSRTGEVVLLDTIFEEDFSDGLDDWTVIVNGAEVPDQLWTYSTADSTAGPVAHFAINADTKDNGYALLDFAPYIAATVDPLTGAEGGVNQDLISPVFSTVNNSDQKLSVTFYQLYRYLNDAQTAFISFSVDGGQSFTQPSEINPRLGSGLVYDGDVLVPIPDSLVGFAETQIRFSYIGGFYSLAIDDIVVSEQPPVQLGIDPLFYAIAPNQFTPSTQVDTIYPFASIYNQGGADQDVELRFTLFDSDQQIIGSTTLDYGSIPANSSADALNFPSAIAMPTTPGVYDGVYSISSGADETDVILDDNLRGFSFVVGENLFAKNVSPTTLIRPNGDNPEYTSGNIYYTPQLERVSVTVDSVIFVAAAVGFEDNGSFPGLVETKVWGYRGDLNADNVPSFSDDPSDAAAELVLLGENFLDIDSTIVPSIPVRLSANASTDGSLRSVELPTGEGYIGFAVTVAYTRANSPTAANDQFFLGANEDLDYFAYDVATSALAEAGRGRARQSTLLVLDANGTSTAQYGTLIGSSPTIIAFVNREGFDVATTQLQSTEFGISPNPVNSTLSVNYDFGSVQGKTQVRILNGLGQTVYSNMESQLGSGKLEISTASLTEGVYYLDILTSGQQHASRTFVVAH